ncbi:TetR/AcrR family transcriptional regulator [Pseudomonas kilonensis]|uniref:TetR/AcrR family transcriptional regulator n=1 Tax=Pseudomonas kilonensis TaxID=132476 RepID=UPI00209DC3CC|nr:TetR/AcrR family transcriptional regulator [Pseudomonas kilonensis]MCP1457597.1 AcrR family transcriptional regulator [Pseudomonas kilonensis]
MMNKRKPSEARERDLQLALTRIQRGRSHTGETKITIAAVAREAGVSTALIHNHYPHIAEAIREAQGRSSRIQRDLKAQDLSTQRDKNRVLRQEIKELRNKVASLASINEVLLAENTALKEKHNVFNMIDLAPKQHDNSYK